MTLNIPVTSSVCYKRCAMFTDGPTAAPSDPWELVKVNPTYLPGSLTDDEGHSIRWHSPSSKRSSQVFCISAFGSLRQLPDGQEILTTLLTRHFERIGLTGPWELTPEYHDRQVLDETGKVTPTSVDVLCRSKSSVVCIESKFMADALDGFGSCSQVPKNCRGHYGPGSDIKTNTAANCRLEVPEAYWRRGKQFFQDDVFLEQSVGEICPFSGHNFQLMRNVLFAACSGAGAWATLAIVPDRVSAKVRQQASMFREQILTPEYRERVSVATYEELIVLLRASTFAQSNRLGEFLAERIDHVCPPHAAL